MMERGFRFSLTVTFLAAACAQPEPEPDRPTADDVARGLLTAIQLEGEAPTTFDLAERMAHYKVPGVSVAVMDSGEIAWARGWGTADLETGAPVTPGTLFQAASISKPVGALAALGLVEDGALALDAPVNDYLKSWKLPDNEFTADSAVTLRGILTHSAGLTVWGFPGYRKDEPFSATQEVATNVQVLEVDVPEQGSSTVHADAAEPDTFFDVEDGQTLVFERDETGAVVAVSASGQTRLVKIPQEG